MKIEELERLVDALNFIKRKYKLETWSSDLALDILKHDLNEWDLEWEKWIWIKDLMLAYLQKKEAVY